VWSNVVETPQNPGPARGGRFQTPYANVEPDFVPAVTSTGEVAFGRESGYARANNIPSVNDALLIADSKYLGVLSDDVRTIRFSTLGPRATNQVKGMIWLSQQTKGRTFVFLIRPGQTLGNDIKQFAQEVGVDVKTLSHPLIK